MRKLIYLLFLLPFITTGQWSVDTGAETVVPYTTTTSSLGLIENDESESLNNANKLIAGINAHPEGIDIDGVYFIQTPSTSLTSTNIRLSSINGGELKSNKSFTKLFDSPRINNIEVGGVTFSDIYSGGGDYRLFFEGAQSVKLLKFNSNFFNGNIFIYSKDFDQTTDPSTFKIGSFIYRNNTIRNNRKYPFSMENVPFDVCEIVNNEIHNFDNVVFRMGVSNNHAYESDIYTLRPLITYTDNYIHNDIAWEGQGTLGSYITPIIVEANQINFLRNHTEGIWTTLNKAVYDAYLSCNIVNYKNNVNKNNIQFYSTDPVYTTLMKGKGASEGATLVTRNYEDNHFITEESWIDQVVLEGANKAYSAVIFAQTGADVLTYGTLSSTYIKNNTFDIYSLIGKQDFQVNALNYEVSGNTFNVDYSNGIFTETVLLTDENAAESVIFSDNTFNVLNTNQTESFPAMVKFLDQRTVNTDKIGSIVMNNNSGTVKNYIFFGNYDTDYFEMTGNDFETYPETVSYPYFIKGKGTYAQESNISDNVFNYNTGAYLFGEKEYGASSIIDETIIFNGLPSTAGGQDMRLKRGEASSPNATYRRTYNVNDGKEIFYFEFTLSYDTDHWNVSFINTNDALVTYRMNNNDGVSDGSYKGVKVVNSGTNNTATTVGFNNTDGWAGFAHSFTAGIPIKLNVNTYNNNVNQSTGSVNANAGADVAICEGESTTLTASGGSGYSWNTGATTQSITVNPNSTTTYTVTVAEGAESDTDQVVVTVNDVTANAGSDRTITEGDNATLTASGGGSYLWNTGATTASITVRPAATTTYSVTVTNNGCDATDDVNVTVNPAPIIVSADAGPDESICLGDNVTLTASGGSGYSWNTGATTQSITVNPNSTTTYTVTVTEGAESDTDQVVVTVNDVTANAGSDRTITEGTSISLNATGGDSYLWNTGATTATISVSPIASTTYSVTVTDNGCDATDDVNVTVNPAGTVSADAGPDESICLGENVTLTASGGSGYSWNTGATTQSITVNPNSTNAYTVTVTEGAKSDTDQVIVTVNNVTANAGSDKSITEGDNITLTASGGDSYLWNTEATTATITVSPIATTTYSVTVTNNGCDATDDVKVTVNPAPVIVTADAGPDESICLGDNVTLTASGGSGYSWNTGATTQSITVNPNSTTTYTVTVTEGAESDTDQVVVSVNDVTANAGSDRTIMEGETIILVATGGDSYIWNTGEKTNSINVSPSSTRTYSVTAYKGSCQDNADVKVIVEPIIVTGPLPAQADAGEDMTICLGQSITLNGSGGDIYVWSTGETSSSISVNPSRTATFELTATRGGVTNTDSVTVTVENCENQIISDEEDLAILEMAVYPNPTKGKLTILINNLDEDANFIINDTKGSLIYSDYISGEKTQFEKQINLSRYSNGLYFVRLYTAQQYLVKKVMVQ